MKISAPDNHIRMIEIPLTDSIEWHPLRDYLMEQGVPYAVNVFRCIQTYDQGSVSNNVILVNWRTDSESQGNTRVVTLFNKRSDAQTTPRR